MRRISAGLVVLAALAFPINAAAAPIFVNTAASSQPGKCSLKDAIAAANTELQVQGCPPGTGTGDRIEFLLPLPATIDAGETMAIATDLEIVGPAGGQLTVTGGHAFRVFEVSGSSHVSISNLAITAGRAKSAAGLLVGAGATVALNRVTLSDNEAVSTGLQTRAGGILSEGSLTLTESTVAGNTARSLAASGTAEAVGGGIQNAGGNLLLDRSTVSGNSALASPVSGTAVAVGGGILSQGTLTLRDSTVSGNEAAAFSNESSFAQGGGILTAGGLGGAQGLTIERSTLAGNATSGQTSTGGALASTMEGGSAHLTASTLAANTAASGANVFTTGSSAPLEIRSTILARPGGGESCNGPVVSLGFNLDEGSSCGFAQPSDQSGVDPLLAGGLAANGGPTQTIALLHGSPAIDRGVASAGESTDQRGLGRPVVIPSIPSPAGGDGADVGAFEVQVPHASLVVGPAEGETIADPSPTFEFAADEAGATFLCGVDGPPTVPCSSPYKLAALAGGTHTFTLAAVGATGYAEEPAVVRTFTVATRQPTPGTQPSPPPSPQATPSSAPRTKLARLPVKTTKRFLRIRFSADQSDSTFSCRLDRKKWRPCRSPFVTPRLSLGWHTFRVRASGPTGIVDPIPATKTFKVLPRRAGG